MPPPLTWRQTRYKLDDPRPMLFKTNDYGKTWTDISQGIRDGDYTRVIREDPVRRGLLYAGTETGVYLSTDDGSSWKPLQANLPSVPVYDLKVQDGDLVVATHGRSFWVLDDLTHIRQITDDLAEKPYQLLEPRTTHRLRSPGNPRKPSPGKHYRLGLGADVTYTEVRGPDGETFRKFLDAGENPPHGVIITYYLKEKPEEGNNPQCPRLQRPAHQDLLQPAPLGGGQRWCGGTPSAYPAGHEPFHLGHALS